MKKTKNIINIILFIPIILIFISDNVSFAGAWGMKKGSLYERISFNYYFANKEYNKNGEVVDFANNGSFSDYHISNYFEYGLYDNLTIINSIYIKKLRKNDYTIEQKTSGIGDIDIGAKMQIMKLAEGVLSGQILTKIPWAYEKDNKLPLGNGQFDFEMRLLYGHSLYPAIPGYCNFEAGYRWRLQEPSDEIRYLIEIGLDITKNIYGRVKLDGIFSADNGKDIDSKGNPTATNNYNIGKLDAVIGYKINKHWGLEAGYTPSIYGKNTAKGSNYTLAITYQMP
jgi:hypothetical protein